MTNLVLLLLIMLEILYECNAHKILLVTPLPDKSHAILADAMVKHLLNAGHEVTYITPFPKNLTNPKLHEIDVSSHIKMVEEMFDLTNLAKLLEANHGGGEDQSLYFLSFNALSKSMVEHENVMKLLRDPTQNFDVVIAEWMFNELYSGFAGLYNAHLIWFSSMEPHWMILNLVDEYTNPAYEGYIVDASPPFTFQQRFTELWNVIKMIAVRETLALFLQTRGYNNIIAPLIEARGRVAPSFSELRYNATLILGNSYVSMGQATRLPQNYKPIGGYHVDETTKPLPENLQRILDNAKHGVIYFSMGSILKSMDFPEELKKDILKVFGGLKQTVLWKFEETLPSLPKNVHILHWAPQQSILRHPNCVLFITHGGLLSITETVFAGKPIIGIPVFADQFVNVARAVNTGFALKVKFSYSMGPNLKSSIEEILNNPRYTQRAKELSFIYHDRSATPGQELVHWVEHVVNTGGAPHLRSPALMVPWYQKLYLDLIILIMIAIIFLKKVIKLILSVIRPKKLNDSKIMN